MTSHPIAANVPAVVPPQSVLLALFVGLSLAVVASPGTDATAAPLTIRARTAVSVTIERTKDGVIVRGTLRDDVGRPVAFERVSLEIPEFPVQTRDTDDAGTFEVAINGRQLTLLEGLHGTALPWTVRYTGDRVYGQSTATGAVDLDRAPTSLKVRCEPPSIGLNQGKVLVHTRLGSTLGPVENGDVRVRVGDGAELIGQTDAAGRSTFVIPPDLLGSPGRYEVRARFLGNSLYSAAEERAFFEALKPTRLTLRVAREGDLRTGRYRFSGRLSDTEGALPDATIAIVARSVGQGPHAPAEAVVALATTQEAGIYLAAIGVRGLLAEHEGELTLRAVYDARDGQHQASISEPVILDVPPPPGVPARWYLVGLLVLGLLLATAQFVRYGVLGQVLARLRAWRADRRRRPDLAVTPHADPPLLLPAASPPDHAPRVDWICGKVVDAHSGALLPGASVTLEPLGSTAANAARTSGVQVALGPIPAGHYRLVVSAPGYLEREMPVAIPHGGDLDGVHFGLVAIRRRIRDAYIRAVTQYQGALRWGRDTPREALAQARSVDAGEERALVELRTMVEVAWFSPTAPKPSDAVRARQILEHLEPPA